MKTIKKILCLSLVMLMLLLLATACTPAEDPGEDIVGRYVEHDVTPEGLENIAKLKKLDDGSLVAYDELFAKKYVSKDGGKTWETSAGPGLDDPRFGHSYNASVGPDGTILFVYMEFPEGYDEAVENNDESYLLDMEPPKQSLLKVSPDGTIAEVPFKDLEAFESQGKSFSFSTLNLITKDLAFVVIYEDYDYNSEDEYQAEPIQKYIMLNITTGETLYEKMDNFFGGGMSMVFNGENFYLSDYDGNIHAFNILTGEKVAITNKSFNEEVESSGMSMNYMQIFQVNEKGDIYAIDNAGLRLSRADGSEIEKLMESTSYSFGAGNSYVNGLEVVGETFITTNYEEKGSKIYLYEWDAEAIWSAAESITVWSLYDVSSLRIAIGVYRAKFPNGLVEYEIGLRDEYNATKQDIDSALQSLNTRLLAGEGPDVIILDGTNIKNYVNNGLLLNLADIVDTSEMYDKIITPFKDGKELFYIPTRFELPVLLGKEGDLEKMKSLDDVIAMINSGPDKPVWDDNDPEAFWRPLKEEEQPNFTFDSIDEIFELLWMSSGDKIIKDGKIDKEQLKILLEKTKEIAERYSLTEPDDSGMGMGMVSMSGSGEVYRYPGSLMNYNQQRAKHAAIILDRITVLSDSLYYGTNVSSNASGFPGITEGTWSPKVNVAISAASNHKTSAANLLQTMLEKEAQGSVHVAGLPVTKSGVEAQIVGINKFLKEYSENMNDGVTRSFSFDFGKLVENLGAPMDNDRFLYSTLLETANSYCLGNVDLEGAVSEIEQKLKTYLGEQQ